MAGRHIEWRFRYTQSGDYLFLEVPYEGCSHWCHKNATADEQCLWPEENCHVMSLDGQTVRLWYHYAC
jgi:hypothetical protein